MATNQGSLRHSILPSLSNSLGGFLTTSSSLPETPTVCPSVRMRTLHAPPSYGSHMSFTISLTIPCILRSLLRLACRYPHPGSVSRPVGLARECVSQYHDYTDRQTKLRYASAVVPSALRVFVNHAPHRAVSTRWCKNRRHTKSDGSRVWPGHLHIIEPARNRAPSIAWKRKCGSRVTMIIDHCVRSYS